ncbi:hypothetical protein F4780DRAFT_782650 [Xylariomycetidae sp. FL0641]|nr:hypothetical protein F4780DRAFT_782650 [Xylariomycetidae sp. FL0641]
MDGLLTASSRAQGSINRQISRYETTAVYTHPEAKVDIVLVHGLNGDPQKTWTAKNGVFWPSDLLPASLRDARANVLVYGYNADVYSKKHGSTPSDNFIFMHAQTLVTSLTHYRKDEMSSHNPIIWVCHSLGGILVKRALLYSNDLKTSQHEDYRSIYVSTYGLVFLGTPHTGSDMATWGTVLQAMSDAVVPKSFFQSESVLLKTLKRDNETLQNINSHFLDIYQRFKILMAHENHKTDLKGTRMLVVDSNSASPQLPGVTYYAIEATHSGMCKFDSKNAPGYRTVATALRDWVAGAPDVISTRWRVEEDEKLARAKHEIEERMKPWINSQRIQAPSQGSKPSKLDNHSKPLLPSSESESGNQTTTDEDSFPSQQSHDDVDPSREPLFVRPTVFRPNTFFKGREEEMKRLHRMLKDRHRLAVGTSSVLIQSMPGGGKSHLARQYVFKHRYDYPGGIFWIRAKSVQELDYGYWDIAKTLRLREARNLDHAGLDATQQMVKAVQAWLSRNEDWLLVLDGIHFDLPDLQHYIPFAKKTSIIYTSTERTPGEAYQFDNPQIIALDALPKREAQELLFEEMDKKKPWTQDDMRRAEELVELMDRLPLMIHVSATYLKTTREPLAKYLRSYRSRPKVGNLPAYRAVREQLEHRGNTAALNLMSIISFLGTHIPVEMAALGAKALDKRTPVKTTDPQTRRTSLNNTFKILIAFALIERNENSDVASATSSRSTRSVDMGQDSLDILRIHGIVQAFFVDVLASENQAPFWLERAICVFCRAYDSCNDRVAEDPQTGRPEDFRRFVIHGRRLITHLDRFEKKSMELEGCRERVEERLQAAQSHIDHLTERADAASHIATEEMISVFERTNSLSEADSETPPPPTSLFDPYTFSEESEAVETPSIFSPIYSPTGEHNPYHWHVNYPYGIPPTDPDDLNASKTVTPQLDPTEVFESMSMPDDAEVTRRVFGPNHRTIRKHAERRYRDHAGSWRASPQIVSDPRVSISREVARGVINSSPAQQSDPRRMSITTRLTAGSEAELALNHQLKASTPTTLQAGDTVLAEEGTQPNARPRLMTGRSSYANAMTEETRGGEHPITPTFSSPPPSSKDAAASIMRLKDSDRPVSTEGLAPVKISSPLRTEALSTASLSEQVLPTPEQVLGSQASVVTQVHRSPSNPASHRGSGPPSASPSRPSSVPLSRTTQSSPSQASGPFRPPPIPIEVNSTSTLRSSPHAWPPQQPRANPGGYAPDEGGGGGGGGLPYAPAHPPQMAHSLPTIIRPYPVNPPLPPYPTTPHTTHVPAEPIFPDAHAHAHSTTTHTLPAPWAPAGYSSQPMSRDPSHQSSASYNSSSASVVSSASAGPPPPAPRHVARSTGGSSDHTQPMQRPRSRRPSLVETEPSPRLAGLDDPADGHPVVVATSYGLYDRYHQHHRHNNPFARRRGASTSTTPLPAPATTTTPRSAVRAGGGGDAVLRASTGDVPSSSRGWRAAIPRSLTGRKPGSSLRSLGGGSSRRRRRRSSSDDDGDERREVGVGEILRGRRSKDRDRGTQSASASVAPASGAAAAAAGGGGIRLADGRVFEFGSPRTGGRAGSGDAGAGAGASASGGLVGLGIQQRRGS